MNPIEHVWDFIGRKINQRNPKCQNIDELKTAILLEWQQFPQERLKCLVRSMGFMWPNVVVHEHWPVSQRMIVEMGDYAWSEHIVTVFLACQITINKRGGYTRY
jgi:hypothetical protein